MRVPQHAVHSTPTHSPHSALVSSDQSCKSELCWPAPNASCLQSGKGGCGQPSPQLIQLVVAQTDQHRFPRWQAATLRPLRCSGAVRILCDVITHQSATIRPSDGPTGGPQGRRAQVLVVVAAAMKNNTCAVRASAVGRLAPSGAVGARRCVHKIVMECGSIETHSVRQLQATHWTSHCYTVRSVRALPPRSLQLMSVLCVHRLWGERC